MIRPAEPIRVDRAVRRSVLGLVLAAVIAFGLVAAASVYMAGRIARDEELAEAVRGGGVVARAVFAPLLPAAMRGDARAFAALDQAVRIRSGDGTLVRVKVFSLDGQIVYSDDHSLIGQRYLSDEVLAAIHSGTASAGLSTLDDPDNAAEAAAFDRLVEVYLPLHLADDTMVVFEMYSTDTRLRTSEAHLRGQLILLSVGSLALLLLLQLPVSVLLLRRVGRAQRERARLLGHALAASDRERRNVARDLHDGVVQELAGAGYALDALARALPAAAEPRAQQLLDLGQAAVRRSVRDLRTLIVDIDPPNLTARTVGPAIAELADRLRTEHSIGVEVSIDLPMPLPPPVAATVYRFARECLANIAAHADARRARVELTGDGATVRLLVEDDGRGLPAGVLNLQLDGHVGLRLLAEAATDLGGQLTADTGSWGGARLRLELPVTAPSAA